MRLLLPLAALSLGLVACSDRGGSGSKKVAESAPKGAANETVALPEDAAPTAPATPIELPEDFRVAMRRGRALMKRGEYPAAAQSFEKALDVVPGHARAFSELGWAAFHTADHARALEATRAAIRSAHDDNLKAASLYNLGRIHEELHQPDKAIEAYEQSLELRPHKSVAMRLAQVESTPETPAQRSVKMLGPFDNLSDFCHQKARLSSFYQMGGELEPECDARPVQAANGAVGDVLAAQLFEIRLVQQLRESGFGGGGEGEMEEFEALQLGLKTSAGWYVLLDALNPYELGDARPFETQTRLALVGEDAGTPTVELRYLMKGERKGRPLFHGGIIACTLSEEGRPSCSDHRKSQSEELSFPEHF